MTTTSLTIHDQTINRNGQKYLEENAIPMITNTYLKVAIFALGAVCVMLGALLVHTQKALTNVRPLIIRINDVGHAEAVDYQNFTYRPQEAENKYYLSRWAELFYGRNRYTFKRDLGNSLYFLAADQQRAIIDENRKYKTVENYMRDTTLPYVDIDVKNVVLDNLSQAPYSARIEFDKVYSNPLDHRELKREHWAASVTYFFAEHVENEQLHVNPLGLTIVQFRADQAFN